MSPHESLQAAFAATRYRVIGRGCEIRINQPMPAPLGQWLAHRGRSVWLITADNPGAEPTGAAINASRRAVLDSLLERPGLHVCRTLHEDPQGHWPDEYGRMIAGLDAGLACALGRRFGQAAIVHLSISRPARLIWLGGD